LINNGLRTFDQTNQQTINLATNVPEDIEDEGTEEYGFVDENKKIKSNNKRKK